MLEFIGGTVVVYVVVSWLVDLFTGKGARREVYIIREYEIHNERDENLNHEDDREPRPDRQLPENVIRFRR